MGEVIPAGGSGARRDRVVSGASALRSVAAISRAVWRVGTMPPPGSPQPPPSTIVLPRPVR